MKKLGKIFKKFWKQILVVLVIVLVLFIVKPFEWLSKMFPIGKYKKIAYQVYLTMWTLGTNEDELFTILGTLKLNELVEVYKAFATRGYRLGGGEPLGKQLNLFEWFDKELNRNEREKMRGIWEKTGIEITF